MTAFKWSSGLCADGKANTCDSCGRKVVRGAEQYRKATQADYAEGGVLSGQPERLGVIIACSSRCTSAIDKAAA